MSFRCLRCIRVAVLAAVAVGLNATGMVIDPVDPAFGVAIAEYPPLPGAAFVQMHRMAVGPGGRVTALVTLGQLRADSTPCTSIALQAFTASGQTDNTFASGGRASAAAMGLSPCVQYQDLGFAVTPDGGYYLVAIPDEPGSPPPRVWKVTADGRADSSFPSGGGALPGVLRIRRPVLQVLPNGGVAIGGTFIVPAAAGPAYPALGAFRLRADGTPDPNFGNGGVALAVPSNQPIFDGEGGGMAILPDGATLVAGNIFEDDAGAKIYTDAAIARFTPQGALDLSYGNAGFAIPFPGASTYAQSMAVLNSGEAVLAGVQSRDVPFAFLFRIKSNGQLDLSFGDGGIAGTDRFAESNFDPLVVEDATRRVYATLTDPSGHTRILRYGSDGRLDPAFGLDGQAVIAAQDWSFGGRGDLVLDADGKVYLGAGGFSHGDDITRFAIGVTRIAANGGHRSDISAGTAIIYYNASLDHYFMTANPAEQLLLDSGTTKGWARTGQSFSVVASLALDPELSPVCRYYGSPAAHLDSHFFSAAPDECAAVAQKFSASWLLETSQAFQVHLPDRVTGVCPRGSDKVFRAFNGRADANHFYGVYAVAPPGWIYEGYGPGPVPTAFCAPLF